MTVRHADPQARILHQDCLTGLQELEPESVDLVVTDPPYGISFMGRDWDKAVPDMAVWRECLRVLKPGAFAFVMCIPRQDCQSKMVLGLQEAGFEVGFTPMYWAYGSGFPKAMSISKAVDKRPGAEREVVVKCKEDMFGSRDDVQSYSGATNIGKKEDGKLGYAPSSNYPLVDRTVNVTAPATPEARALDGSYAGFQPKPAVEVILVAMKPLSEKTYVDQALKNGKGVTWLEPARIPYESEGTWQGKNAVIDNSIGSGEMGLMTAHSLHKGKGAERYETQGAPSGRFPANLLCSDDVLNDGRGRASGDMKGQPAGHKFGGYSYSAYHKDGDSGSFSRYFDLDAWFSQKLRELPASVQKTFPFLIVAKASKREKERFLDIAKSKAGSLSMRQDGSLDGHITMGKNAHPTVKPVKLMAYLITLGSRPGDTILDPFLGSGTTAVAATMLGRKCIGMEIEERYCEIARARLAQMGMAL